jgi:homocysteine S-methyltransferase
MDLNFFKKIRILDGGTGQELLARGLVSKGTLWSASALIDEKNHQLLIDTHLSFIESGADVIVTNTFTSRKVRMLENKVDNFFKYANLTACELALKAKEISKKNILIAGSIPAQNNTYEVDKRNKNIIKKNFYDQASIIQPYIDFFYLDVISSGREIEIALDVIEKLNKPVLVGLYIKKNGKLPSGETITEIVKKYKNNNWLGIILACVSPEIIQKTINELKKTGLPFGFKANLWGSEPLSVHKFNKSKFNEIGENPNIAMGKRDDVTGKIFYNFVKQTINNGATILGGCCETNFSHIKEISKLK